MLSKKLPIKLEHFLLITSKKVAVIHVRKTSISLSSTNLALVNSYIGPYSFPTDSTQFCINRLLSHSLFLDFGTTLQSMQQ